MANLDSRIECYRLGAKFRPGGVGMGRKATGELKKYARKDGTTTYSLRIRALGNRWTVPLGNELDGWNDKRAELELQNTMGKIKAGVWRPPVPLLGVDADPTFHEYASHWLAQVEPLLRPGP